jgi:aspartyl-tRNA(Asn)/glutamyl-tRNA(Gln) amidotransferase subunit A
MQRKDGDFMVMRMTPGQSYRQEVERNLEAIRIHNGTINALLSVDEEAALGQANDADAASEKGDWGGLLHGETVTLKDCIDVAGKKTTFGSVRFGQYSNRDAHLVGRLRKEGACLIGKNNLSEFCYGSTNYNEHYGPCRNPWNVDRVSGGSSGGSAAAVAAGMSRISIGTDTGGSIRIPASLCGVVGLRPSIGRISSMGCLPCSADFDAPGPLARTVSDVARAYVAAAGYDAADPRSINLPAHDVLSSLRDGIEGLRIGIPRKFYFEEVAPEVVSGVMAAARVLEGAGATLLDLTIEDADVAQHRIGFTLFAADMAQYHKEKIEKYPGDIGPEVLARLNLGLSVSAHEYIQARRWLASWKAYFQKLLDGVDLILTPTTPDVAPYVENSIDMIAATKALSRLTCGFGAVGLPAMSLPCGFTSEGLPIGLQLVGRWYAEATVLRAGIAYQQQTEFHRQRPILRARCLYSML